MSKKTKVSVRLEPGEAFVVGAIQDWEHLIKMYRNFADGSITDEERSEWLDAAKWVEEWVDNTYVGVEDSEVEDDQWS